MNSDYWRDPAWNSNGGDRPPFWGYQGLRRYPEHGRVSGVCAGIAQHWGIKVKWVRFAAILALIFFTMPTLICYGLATLFLKLAEPEPVQPAERASEKDSWATGDLPPDLSFPNLRRKFRELEERAGAMETQVTSQEFHLRRDFRRMGEA
ncbi:PspC domain-containing protein [Dongia mobilis]|uniref:PspC domain-containing protein n=1 Tax=Dongia sp. TaxID=1977262 RepID=UPI0026F336BD